MKRTWTIIGVADVPQSFEWYQSLLACRRRTLLTTTSGKSSTRMERSYSVSMSGVPTGIPR